MREKQIKAGPRIKKINLTPCASFVILARFKRESTISGSPIKALGDDITPNNDLITKKYSPHIALNLIKSMNPNFQDLSYKLEIARLPARQASSALRPPRNDGRGSK